MKKLFFSAVCAVMGMVAFAASEYQVYDIKFNVKTTVAKGLTTATSCCGAEEETYAYRERGNVVIKGVLGGCGCGSILANGVCQSAILYLWDETHKIAITNVETDTGWRVQRVGKKGNVVEHFVRMKATYGDENQYWFDVTLCGFGTYKENKKDSEQNYVSSINGWFGGFANAPYYYKAGKCSACYAEPSLYLPTDAKTLCDCETADDADMTPFGGTYTVKFSSSKSSNVSKKGISQKNFGLPDYVAMTDCVGTNIGE